MTNYILLWPVAMHELSGGGEGGRGVGTLSIPYMGCGEHWVSQRLNSSLLHRGSRPCESSSTIKQWQVHKQ